MLRNIECYRQIYHVLGDHPAPELRYIDILRQAAGWLSGIHDWRFLLRRMAKLDVRGRINLTAATYDHATLTLTEVGAFADYSWVAEDVFEATGGTGVTAQDYEIASRTDDDSIVLKSPGLGAAADASADIVGKLPNDSIALPSDFLKFEAQSSTKSIIDGLNFTTPQHLLRLRTSAIEQSSSWNYYGVLLYAMDADGALQPILDIWPESSANQSEQFSVFYKSRIVIGDTDTDVIPIPADYEILHTVLIRACRIIAKGYEEGDEHGMVGMEDGLAKLETSRTVYAAKKLDGGSQPYMGPLKGGAVQSMPSGIRKLLSSEVDSPA